MKPISVILLIIGLVLVIGGNIYDNNGMLYASGVVGFLWLGTAVSSKK